MALSPWFSFLFIFTHDPFSSSTPALMLMTLGILLLSVIMVPSLITITRKDRGHVLPPGFLCLPLVGETLKLVAAYRTEDPENFIDERVSHHGRLFTTHVFGERTVFSADPEFNRQVLTGEGRSFECSYPSSISTLLGRHSLLLMKGPLHKRMHSLILCRFSSPSALREFLLPDVDRLVRRTLDSWIPEGASNSTSTTIRLLEQAKKITFEITVKQLLSFDPGVWTESLRREYLLLIEGFFSVPLALPCFLSSTTTYGRALQARNKVAEALRAVLRKRRQEKQDMDESGQSQQRQSVKKKQDMVEELMELAEGGAGFSEDEMVDFILALLVAGYETTSTIMTLAVKFLTENPPALALLLEEHDSIKAKKKPQVSDALEWADYKSMPFTQYVINETLRVANVISGVFRRATTDVHFKGYTIPKGCMVFTSFRAVHLDLNYYEDARTFNPWRWQGKDAPQQTSTGGGIFTPFGGGPRLCPGYELARVEISVFLHHLVTRFRWEVAEKDKLVFFPTTRTLKGFPINVQTRRANV